MQSLIDTPQNKQENKKTSESLNNVIPQHPDSAKNKEETDSKETSVELSLPNGVYSILVNIKLRCLLSESFR